ncbi:MAG TPA: hypothetical protein DCF44_05430, partial [Chitinophagaceae bacterium]|nr:hypothetical protein [Chitinophagaceae bacterium]
CAKEYSTSYHQTENTRLNDTDCFRKNCEDSAKIKTIPIQIPLAQSSLALSKFTKFTLHEQQIKGFRPYQWMPE